MKKREKWGEACVVLCFVVWKDTKPNIFIIIFIFDIKMNRERERENENE